MKLNKIISIALSLLLMTGMVACSEGSGDIDDSGDGGSSGDNSGPDIPGVPEVATNSWMMSSMAKLDTYKSQKPSNTITLHMAKGEAEHVQLVLETDSKGKLAFERHGAQPEIGLEIKEIRAFDGVEDVLVVLDEEANVETKTKLVKLWLTFETNKNTPAGKYSEVITFKGTAGEIIVGVDISVYDVAIPETPSITSLFGINPAMISSATGKDLLEKQVEFSDALLKRRITPYFCKWLSGTMKTECYTSPYPIKDERMLDYLDDPRMKHIVLPYHSLSDTDFSDMVGAVKSRFPDKKQVFYIWDEPTQESEYTQINDMSAKIHVVNPDAQIITTFFRGPTDANNTNFNDLLSVWDHLSGTSIFCTGVWSLQQNESRSAQCKAKCADGQEWWTYVCMGDRPGLAYSSTSVENRAVLWRSYKEQPSGFLYWVVNGFSSLSPLRPRAELPAGDGIMMYPGEAFGSDKPAVSMRLERWCDGAEDYELLLLLEQKKSREEALALLDNIYKGPAAGSIAANADYVEAFKKKILEELTK